MIKQERVRRIIEIIAIGVGISGVSLSNLSSTQPLIFYISIFVLIVILVSLIFTWKRNNIFTKKDKINQIWQQLISGAFESIEAFAGDVSWIQRDKEKIRDITKAGIKVSVLCHNPFQKENAQSNVIALFEAGAEVKFFDDSKYYPPYGLLIDGDSPAIGTALTVDREPKPNIPENREGLRNVDIYNYRAIRYIPRSDSKHIQALSTLFDAMWEQAREGVVLIPLDVGYLMKNELLNLLRLVKQYSHITEADIDTETVHIGEIFASTTYVKTPSLHAISPICYSYKDQNISEYKPVYCISNYNNSLILPPILEVHGDKLVVVDGTHRLFHLYAEQQRTGAFCVIVNNAPDLPCKPVPFKNVRAWPRNLSREHVFIEYNHSLYRNFVPMDEKLGDGNFSNGIWSSR